MLSKQTRKTTRMEWPEVMTNIWVTSRPQSTQQLHGESNYVVWNREFELAAMKEDVLELLKGDEEELSMPNPEDYDKVDTVFSMLSWQQAIKKYELYRVKRRVATSLLYDWVSDGIAIDIEDYDNPSQAYIYLIHTYKVSNAYAREQTLQKMIDLNLTNCDSMTDYLNEHRWFKQDLIRAGYDTFSTDTMIIHILAGLPSRYRNFLRQYEWANSVSKESDDTHKLQFLFDRLLNEEKLLNREKEQKHRTQAQKRKNWAGDGDNVKSRTTGNEDDKKHMTCGHCGKRGHPETICWELHPEFMLKHLRGKFERRP